MKSRLNIGFFLFFSGIFLCVSLNGASRLQTGYEKDPSYLEGPRPPTPPVKTAQGNQVGDGVSKETVVQKAQKEEELKRIMEQTAKEEERRRRIVDANRVKPNLDITSDEEQIEGGQRVPLEPQMVKRYDAFVERMRRDLARTDRIDLFQLPNDVNHGDPDKKNGDSDSISMENPQKPSNMSDEDFQKALFEKKKEARKNKLRALVISVNTNSEIEDGLVSYLYKRIGQGRYYTAYPQEIDFVGCFAGCIEKKEVSTTLSDNGELVIKNNVLDVERMKEIQAKYDLDLYVRIGYIYEHKQLRFQVQFFNAKTNRLLWSRYYNYYIPSSKGQSFSWEVGPGFYFGKSVGLSRDPIGVTMALGARLQGVGHIGSRISVIFGYNEETKPPDVYLIGGFFDGSLTDGIRSYNNVVSLFIGVDLGLGVRLQGSVNPYFFQFSPYLKLNFMQSAYLRLGGLFDVGASDLKTVFSKNVGPAFFVELGVIFF